MIEPSELHRYFQVQETATGRKLWLLGSDTRYERAGGEYGYQPAPGGEYILVKPWANTAPRGFLVKPSDVEPLPGGAGLWHPAAWEHWGKLDASYEGSWRQCADGPP